VGELVDLSVRVPGRLTSLTIKGCVVWSRATGAAPGMGLAFVSDNSTRGKLERVLARLAKGNGKA
jgi:Tfp pilus assembly protein PilZ